MNFARTQLGINFQRLDEMIMETVKKGLRESKILEIANRFNSIITEYCMARKIMDENMEFEEKEEEDE